MIRLSHAASPAALLRGLDSLLVIAPSAAYRRRGFLTETLGADLAGRCREVGKTLSPGDFGQVGKSLGGRNPTELAVAALPDEVSRHNSPTRSEPIRRAVKAAGLGRAGKRGVLVVVDKAEHGPAAARAVGRSLPLFSRKKGSNAKSEVRLLVVDKQGKVCAKDTRSKESVAATREAARLVDTPPTEMAPSAMVREAKKLLRNTGVTFKEVRGDALLKEGLGGIHAVGRTAVDAPRMLVASWKPAKAKGPHVALVGKGVTYDTGGLHLKPRGGMEGMKCDMGGAAAVLGAFKEIVAAKMPVRTTLILCLAENAIGPEAYKPDDIIDHHSGLTVEVNNTDAEGRLLLADGVSYAARKLKADVILDAATLTGAQMIATGQNHAAVVSNDAKLEKTMVEAGTLTGDLLHPLPFAPEFYRAEFASPVADLRNSVKNRANAQSSCAAIFIHAHIADTDAKWAHVDLAGPAFREDRGTGYGVGLLAETVSRLAKA